jgi:hypothetical protein
LPLLQALGLSTTDPLFQLQAYSSYFLPKAASGVPQVTRSLLEREVDRRRRQLQVQQQQKQQESAVQGEEEQQDHARQGVCEGQLEGCRRSSTGAGDAQATGSMKPEDQELYRHAFRDLVLAARDIKYSGRAGYQQGDEVNEESMFSDLGTEVPPTRRSMASSSSFAPSQSGNDAPQRGPTSLSQYLSNSGAVGEVSPSSGGVIIPVYFNSYTTSTGQYMYGRSFASTSCFKWKYTNQLKLVQVSDWALFSVI